MNGWVDRWVDRQGKYNDFKLFKEFKSDQVNLAVGNRYIVNETNVYTTKICPKLFHSLLEA